MRKIKNKISAILICASMCTAMIFPCTVSSKAATMEEVRQAAKDAGVSDFYINQGLKNEDDYTPEQYDKMLEYIADYKDTINIYLAKYFGEEPENYSSQTSDRESDNDFINMSVEEKQQYLFSLSDDEKKKFISTMTNEERNSFIKQLSVNEKTQILTPLIDFADSLGYNISIDSITGSSVDMSIRDDDGNLLDVSSIGVAVDNVGYSYTKIYLTALIMIITSIFGFGAITIAVKKSREENR
jgi:hypothetical protein